MQPHDALFKKVLSDLELAKQFLRIYLPQEILHMSDFSSLRLEAKSFVEEKLKQHHSDMLYSLKMAKEMAYVYVLIEHQSSPEIFMPFRMLNYQLSIMKLHLDKYQKLPVIIPLLFYIGERSPYPYSVDLFDCFEQPDLARQWMFKPLKLIDITVLSDEEIKTHQDIAMLELVQKHIRNRDVLLWFREVVKFAQHSQIKRQLFCDIVEYVIKASDLEELEALFTVIEQEAELYREDSMTIAERLEQRGLERGKQEGMQQGMQMGIRETAKNMLQAGARLDFIKKVTGLTDNELNALRDE